VRVLFHIADEFLTAAVLIFSGIGLLAQQSWASTRLSVTMGMLFYAVIVSSVISRRSAYGPWWACSPCC
jgi:xanthine/uracil permease